MEMDNKEENTLSIFCVDEMLVGEAFRSITQQNLNKENKSSIKELGDELRKIHIRLIKDGYVLKDGKYYKNN